MIEDVVVIGHLVDVAAVGNDNDAVAVIDAVAERATSVQTGRWVARFPYFDGWGPT